MTWVCAVCRAGTPAQVSYSSVLVFGTTDMHKVQQEQNETCNSCAVANVTSYCIRCRCVTATHDTALATNVNLISTHKLRQEYAQHQLFRDSFPCKHTFRKLLRKTSRKHGSSRKPRPLIDGCEDMDARDLKD